MSFVIEVMGVGESTWGKTTMRFKTAKEAGDYAVDLQRRWLRISKIRRVTSKEPANYSFKNGELKNLNPLPSSTFQALKKEGRNPRGLPSSTFQALKAEPGKTSGRADLFKLPGTGALNPAFKLRENKVVLGSAFEHPMEYSVYSLSADQVDRKTLPCPKCKRGVGTLWSFAHDETEALSKFQDFLSGEGADVACSFDFIDKLSDAEWKVIIPPREKKK